MAMHRRTLILSAASLAAATFMPARAQTQRPRLTLDQMFEALKLAPDDASARAVEAQIWQVWMQAGSPAVQLLMRRGMRHLETRSLPDAVEDFDAIIALSPELPEGWNKRATAYYLLGDYDNAVRDIQETLAREPRHFGALSGLSHILEARGDHTAALRAYERALAIHPRLAGHEARLKELRRRALGEES
jgi:tetratricopeptide (TPR) repeat protein